MSIVKSFSITKALFDFCCYLVKIVDAILCCNEEWPSKSDKKNGFIFFIDDLDRIDPNIALEILEMLASIFSFKKCIFVLAIDNDVLMKAAKLKLSKRGLDVNDIQCKHYLNRFVHVSVTIPEELYDIQPFLRESLINISFFTSDELKNSGLIYLLDKVVCCSIGKNPRFIKQLINNLSLIDLFKRHALGDNEEDKNTPWQVETITKAMIFILQCIKINYPELCVALAARPYFKMWDMEFAFKNFNRRDKENTLNLAKQCNASKEWEYALFHICNFDNYSKLKFYDIKSVFGVIDDIFMNFIYKNNVNQSESELYRKIITNVFFHFYRFSGIESEDGIYQTYHVKIIKNNNERKD